MGREERACKLRRALSNVGSAPFFHGGCKAFMRTCGSQHGWCCVGHVHARGRGRHSDQRVYLAHRPARGGWREEAGASSPCECKVRRTQRRQGAGWRPQLREHVCLEEGQRGSHGEARDLSNGSDLAWHERMHVFRSFLLASVLRRGRTNVSTSFFQLIFFVSSTSGSRLSPVEWC